MSKPSNFIVNTDYPTLKNGTTVEASVTIPASVVIPGNGTLQYSTDVTLSIENAILSARIKSSIENKWYGCQQIVQTRDGVNDGFATTYNYVGFAYRVNANTVRCQIHILNPYSTPTTCYTLPDTVSFRIFAFVSPFI